MKRVHLVRFSGIIEGRQVKKTAGSFYKLETALNQAGELLKSGTIDKTWHILILERSENRKVRNATIIGKIYLDQVQWDNFHPVKYPEPA